MNDNTKPDLVSRFFLFLIAMTSLGMFSQTFFKGSESTPQLKKHEYAIVTIDDQGNFDFNGNGSIGLTGAGLVNATKFVAESGKGWRIHSVVGISSGGYVVVVEK